MNHDVIASPAMRPESKRSMPFSGVMTIQTETLNCEEFYAYGASLHGGEHW